MNIFKVLSDGDGRLLEPNVSAFLAYLLDPKQAHGLESHFLEKFLIPTVDCDSSILRIPSKGTSFKVANLSLKSNYDVWVQTEFHVGVEEGRKKNRDIDVTIEISEEQENQSDKLLHVICIENKTRDGSIEEGQLIEELKGIVKDVSLRNEIEGKAPIHITMAFLTPAHTNQTDQEFARLNRYIQDSVFDKSLCINAVHFIWQSSDINKNSSIYSMLSDLLEQDSCGSIDPIHEHTKYIIKCFMSFISSGFQSYKEEALASKRDFSKYEFNGQLYPKSRLPWIVVKTYLQKNKCTFSQLKETFPDSLMVKWKFSGFICTLEEARSRLKNDSKPRYLTKDTDVLETEDNIPVVVNNQWEANGIKLFLDHAKALGFEIKVT